MGVERAAPLLGLLLLWACGPPWAVVTQTLDRVVLTVSDETIAGGGEGNGSPALLERLRGGAWEDVSGPANETFWWISSGFVVGEQGAIYRLGETAEKLTSPTTATLFGVWGADASEAWAVGGSPLGNGENDVILRFDGTAWAKVPSPEPLGLAYFKVWGSARDDVFIVGQGGVSLHYDGTAWKRVMTATRSTLLTVTGRSSTDVWAVGGPPAVLEHWDGTAWSDEALPFEASGLTGVAFASSGELYVVGLAGTRWVRDGKGRWTDESELPVLGDLHATWVGPKGDAWAVGGNYIALDPATARRGIVAHRGGGVPALR